MKLALLQGPSCGGDVPAALAAVGAALRGAGAMGAAVLVVPEVYLPGYNQPDIAGQALAPGSAVLEALAGSARAAGCALVIGYAEAAADGIYNAALVLGADGAVVANYRKIQLYGPRERAVYRPGDGYVTFWLGGVKAAVLICYDVEFAPHIKALADDGAEVILVPTANMMPFVHVVRHTVPAMAAGHGVSIVYANYCGAEGDLTYVGGSLIAGPHGEVLAQAGEGPALLVAEVPARDPARLSTQSADLRFPARA
ncbi:MAG: nitrilase-related carbon-nitrogen hydrolase [Paracoccaceae bacterium]